MILDLILIPLMGVADRWRGNSKDILNIGKAFDQAVYGWLAACLIGHPSDMVTVAVVLGMVVGSGLGWGEPLGAVLDDKPMRATHLEKWQFGVFKRNAKLALVLRGTIWSAAFIPAAYLSSDAYPLLLAYIVAMPLAPMMTSKWAKNEIIRGVMAGLILFVWKYAALGIC